MCIIRVAEVATIIRYIEHILDIFPLEKFREKRVRRFEIAYIAESYYGEKLSFYMDQEEGTDSYDVEVRKESGEAVCRSKVIFC